MATASFVSVNQSFLYIPDDAKATSARVGFLLPAGFRNPPQSITLKNSLLEYSQGVYLFFAALPYDATNPGLLTSFIQAVYTYLDDLMLPGVRFVWFMNPQDFSAGLIGTPLQVTMQGDSAVTRRAIALPQFKGKKKSKPSFYLANDQFELKDHHVWIPKLGWVNIAENLRFKGKITSARITRQAAWWFISITVEVPDELPQKRPAAIGIDVGLNRLATLSTGEEYEFTPPFEKPCLKNRSL